MADTNVSSVPFFPNTAPTRSSASRNQTEGKNAPDQGASFTQVLSSAAASKASLPARLDAPKVGNREPFFPRTPMPFHPDPVKSRRAAMNDLSEAHEGPEIDHAEEVRSGERPQFRNTTSLPKGEMDGEDDVSFQAAAMENGDKASNEFDDRVGAMNESYDHTAVSYPVKRIAQESLDDTAKTTLKQQGLWDVPTMMAAVPMPKTMAMAQVVEAGKGSKVVPVSKPVAQFMASLESELGVSHARLVKAFETLPQGSLSKAPQETMIDVVKNLGLEGEDEIKAIQIYSKMLTQMGALDKKDRLPVLMPLVAGASPAQKEILGTTETAVKTDVAASGTAPRAKIAATRYGAQAPLKGEMSSKTPVLEKVDSKSVDASANKFAGQVSTDRSASSVKAGAGESQGDLQQQFGQQQAQSQGNAVNGLMKQGVSKVSDEGKFKSLSSDNLKVSAHSTASIPSASASTMANPAVVMSPDSQVLAQQQDVKGLMPAGAGLAGASGQAHHDAKQEAIQSIVANARLLAQKGGGEMHMTLKPEHLGEIQLRVAMDGQKVDVQMTTERSDVKKLIEQSVHELKHGLAAHNLNMDKLDVSLNSKNPGTFQQPTRDFAQAREFAQQFHQQNQARRDLAEMDIPGGVNINKNLSSRAESASRMMASEARNRMGGASKLHVVA